MENSNGKIPPASAARSRQARSAAENPTTKAQPVGDAAVEVGLRLGPLLLDRFGTTGVTDSFLTRRQWIC